MRTVGGLDLARRADFSALVTLAVDARQATVTRALRLPQRPYASQIQAIAPILTGLDRLAFDAGGVGDAVGELLPTGAIPVLIVAGDGVSRRNGRWHIGKTRLIGDLLHLARAGRLVVPPELPGRGPAARRDAGVRLGTGRGAAFASKPGVATTISSWRPRSLSSRRGWREVRPP